jgi:hypothetical protein
VDKEIKENNRGDITIPRFINGKIGILDVGVVNPTAHTYKHLAAKTPGYAGMNYHKAKLSKYSALGNLVNKEVLPLICESFGRWTTEAVVTIKRICNDKAKRFGDNPAVTFRRLMQKISITLQKAQVLAIVSRIPLKAAS